MPRVGPPGAGRDKSSGTAGKGRLGGWVIDGDGTRGVADRATEPAAARC